MLHFIVKDTGIGIRQEERGKLFKLFGKLEATARINTSGIGLGLNICRQIIEGLGGTIQLDEIENE
jgi:signal transduction histidine kinase